MKRADAEVIKQDDMLEEKIVQDMEKHLKEELSEDKRPSSGNGRHDRRRAGHRCPHCPT